MFVKNKMRHAGSAMKAVDDGRIHILDYHRRRFVVGLQWETVRATRNLMKEVRRIGKERQLDVVAIRKSDAIQAGFAPRTPQKLRGGYSRPRCWKDAVLRLSVWGKTPRARKCSPW